MNRTTVWIGWAMSALVVLALLADASMGVFARATVESMSRETGFPTQFGSLLGAIMLVCAVLYAIPATAVLGAILATGFLGGAICTHLRIGELGSPPQIISLALGLLAWGGLYLRDARVRQLLPLVR